MSAVELMLVALVFGLVGTLSLGLGLFCFVRDRHRLRQFSEVGEGTVSGFTEPDDEGFVRPCVRFARGHVTVTITGSVASCPPAYRVGQRVAVRHPQGRPDLAIIADFDHLYLFEISSIVFGAVFVGGAILLLVGSLQR